MDLAIIFRGVERLLVILAAMLCLWLSTRVPRGTEVAQGKIKWESYLVELKNVGANVFFAGFGALILVASIFSKLDDQNYSNSKTSSELTHRTIYLTPPAQLKQQTSSIAHEISLLQGYAAGITANTLTQQERQGLLTSMRRLTNSQATLFDIAFGEGTRARFDDYQSKCAGDSVETTKICNDYRNDLGEVTLTEMENFAK